MCHSVARAGVARRLPGGLARQSPGADTGPAEPPTPLLFQCGPIRQCNDLFDCPVGPCRQVAALLRRVLVTTLGYGHGPLPAVRVDRFVDRVTRANSAIGAIGGTTPCHLCS